MSQSEHTSNICPMSNEQSCLLFWVISSSFFGKVVFIFGQGCLPFWGKILFSTRLHYFVSSLCEILSSIIILAIARHLLSTLFPGLNYQTSPRGDNCDHTTNFHDYVIISVHICLYFVSVAQFFSKYP